MEPLTTEEAKQLINLAKQTLLDVLNSPDKGADVEFNADSIQTKDSFIIKIFRGKINKEKYNYGARIAKNGIILLELHINAGNIHINPDGQKLLVHIGIIIRKKTGLEMRFRQMIYHQMIL